jgi:hypothetical protein
MIRVAALAGLAALVAAPGHSACRQALAIGLDVSGSVDVREYALQRFGMAEALENPKVLQLLMDMPEVPVALAIYEWSGARFQRMIVPWTIVDAASLGDVTSALRDPPRLPSPNETAIGGAMIFGLGLLAEQSACWTLTLDLSGDGRSNSGPPPGGVRPVAAGLPVTVNALVVGLPEGHGGDPGVAELTSYFLANVIKGPDAFVETALGFEDFSKAMARKLERELSGLRLGATSAQQTRPPG